MCLPNYSRAQAFLCDGFFGHDTYQLQMAHDRQIQFSGVFGLSENGGSDHCGTCGDAHQAVTNAILSRRLSRKCDGLAGVRCLDCVPIGAPPLDTVSGRSGCFGAPKTEARLAVFSCRLWCNDTIPCKTVQKRLLMLAVVWAYPYIYDIRRISFFCSEWFHENS